MAKKIPEGYSTLTPYITVQDGAKAIEFYKKAFGAEEKFRLDDPKGGIMHAEIKIGNSMLMLSSESAEMKNQSPATLGGTPVSFMMYVEETWMQLQKKLWMPA